MLVLKCAVQNNQCHYYHVVQLHGFRWQHSPHVQHDGKDGSHLHLHIHLYCQSAITSFVPFSPHSYFSPVLSVCVCLSSPTPFQFFSCRLSLCQYLLKGSVAVSQEVNAVKVSQQCFVTLQRWRVQCFLLCSNPPPKIMFCSYPTHWTLIMFSPWPLCSQPDTSPSSSSCTDLLLLLPVCSHFDSCVQCSRRERLKPVSADSSLSCQLTPINSRVCVLIHYLLFFLPSPSTCCISRSPLFAAAFLPNLHLQAASLSVFLFLKLQFHL